jgi:hypothetical protein
LPKAAARARRISARERQLLKTVERLDEEMASALDDVFDLLWVLDLVGRGQNSVEQHSGQPVLAVSAAISERYSVACEAFNRLLEPWRRARLAAAHPSTSSG